MANVKSRTKSQPTTLKKNGRGRPKKITKVLSAAKPDKNTTMVETDVVKDKKLLTPNEKISFVLQHGHKLKNKFTKAAPVATDGKIDKNALSIVKNQIITKRGTIKKKSKDHLNLMDSILMSELMITDSSNPKRVRRQHVYPSAQDQFIDNNNLDGLSDKNKNNSDPSTNNITINIFLNKADESKTKKKTRNKHKVTEEKPKASKSDSRDKPTTKETSHETQSGLTLFQCDYCKKTFKSKSSLCRHIYMHLDIKPHTCKYCNKTFRQISNLRVHLSRKHGEDQNQCNQCDKVFQFKKNLILHLEEHVSQEKQFRCVFCDKKFPQHTLLIKHEREQHLVSGRFQCTICKMSYECRSRLALHVKSHLNIKEYVCQHCGKEFLRQNSIRRHVEVSHGGQRIQCPICKKKLKGHLTEHLRTHEKKRPHVCPECGARFTQSTQLTVHRRSHSGARPYPCRICLRPFTHSNALIMHIRRHTGEKPFACAMCPLAFTQLPHMKAHMKNIHGQNMTYKCVRCSQFFKLKTELESHAKACREPEPAPGPAPSPAIAPAGDSDMNLSRMRYLLALLFTMIVSKDKLKCLGFNKRLIDDLLVDSLEAMKLRPCRDESSPPLPRLRANIDLLLHSTVPEDKMNKFKKENKTIEELLVLLTDEKKKTSSSSQLVIFLTGPFPN